MTLHRVHIFCSLLLLAGMAFSSTSCRSMRGGSACSADSGKQVCLEEPCRRVHCPPSCDRNLSPKCRQRVEATIVATKSLHERPDVEVVKVTELRRLEPQPAVPEPAVAVVAEEPAVEKVEVVEKLVEEADTESIVLEVENASKIIFAEGKKLAIKGSDSVIVVSGGCSELVLTGKRNQIQVDFAEHIKIEGDVNTFVVGTFGRGQIDGNGNVVSWGEGMNGNVPIALSNGEGNEIGRLE